MRALAKSAKPLKFETWMKHVFLGFVSSREVHPQFPNNVVQLTPIAELRRPVLEVFVFQARGNVSATLIATSMRLAWGVHARLCMRRTLLQVAIGVMLTLSALSMKSAPITTVFDAKLENV